MQNQVGVMRPGATWTSVPSSMLGRRQIESDMNFGSEPAVRLTGMDTEYVLVKNTSGGTLTRGTVVKFDTSTPAMFQYVNGTAGAGERGDGVVDSYIASTVAANEYFLLVRKGPCRVTSSTSGAIAVGDALRTAASGRVLEDSVGMGTSVIGYAMEAVAASATLFRAYVDFTGPARVPTAAGPAFYDAGFTVGAEAANVITVAVQLRDQYGVDLTYKACCSMYLSSDTAGDAVASDPGSIAAGTDGTLLAEPLDDLVQVYRSESDGDIDVAITSTGTSTFYLNVICPDGHTVQSGAITFA